MKGKMTLAEFVQQFDVHSSQIRAWKVQLVDGAAEILGSEPKAGLAALAIDLKTLHANIGELASTKDFGCVAIPAAACKQPGCPPAFSFVNLMKSEAEPKQARCWPVPMSPSITRRPRAATAAARGRDSGLPRRWTVSSTRPPELHERR